MAENEMNWAGRWYRSLAQVALAAQRAADASGLRTEAPGLWLQWPQQDRAYSSYGPELVQDTRQYGFPARTSITLRSHEPYAASLRIVAQANYYDGAPPPESQISARGIERELVQAAFDAAVHTLNDPDLARATYYDIRETLAAEATMSQPNLGARGRSGPNVGRVLRSVLDEIEAHPALVALLGVIVSAAVIILVGQPD